MIKKRMTLFLQDLRFLLGSSYGFLHILRYHKQVDDSIFHVCLYWKNHHELRCKSSWSSNYFCKNFRYCGHYLLHIHHICMIEFDDLNDYLGTR